MARTCQLCGRGAMNGNIRSHSNIASKHRRQINLHTLLKKGQRVKACASCIRTETKRLKAKA